MLGIIQNNEVYVHSHGKRSIKQEDFSPAHWT